jgi:hypothetical protein
MASAILLAAQGENELLLVYDDTNGRWIVHTTIGMRGLVDLQANLLLVSDDTAHLKLIVPMQWEPGSQTISSDRLTNVFTPSVIVRAESGTADDLDSMDVFNPSGALDGDMVLLRAFLGDTISITHLNAGGTSGKKFHTATETTIVMTGAEMVLCIYNIRLDSQEGGWFVFPLHHTSKSITATFSGSASIVNKVIIGPMLQGGRITAVYSKLSGQSTALGATAWIGDVHKIPAADADTDGVGTTLWTTTGNRPTIASGGRYQAGTLPDVTTFATGDYLAFFSDQTGSGILNVTMTLEVVYSS